MYIRCTTCHGTVWLRAESGGGCSAKCKACGQSYNLKGTSQARMRSLVRRGQELARKHDIDLPSSCSVLLGILSVQQVRDLSRVHVRKSADQDADTNSDRVTGFDRSFGPAVEAGLLTPQQAVERGRRDVFASRLASRHRLSMSAAEAVADNRMTLLEALRQRSTGDTIKVKVTESPSEFRWKSAIAAVLTMAAIGAWAYQRSDARASRASSPALGPPPVYTEATHEPNSRNPDRVLRMATSVKTGEDGEAVRVLGPDPRSVLVAFCGSSPRRRFEPVNLTPTIPPSNGARLGILRDLDRLDTLFALVIRQDRETRRWTAGDGVEPIDVYPAPEAAIEAALRR